MEETVSYNIDINVSEQDAVAALNRVDTALDGLGDEARAANREINNISNSTRRTSQSIGGVSQQTNSATAALTRLGSSGQGAAASIGRLGSGTGAAAGAIARFGGPILLATVALKGVEGAARLTTSAFRQYSESTEATKAVTGLLTDSYDDLKEGFAEAAFGGGRFEEVIVNLRTVLENLQPLIDAIGRGLGTIASLGTRFLADTTTAISAVSRLEDPFEAAAENRNTAAAATQRLTGITQIYNGTLSSVNALMGDHAAVVSDVTEATRSHISAINDEAEAEQEAQRAREERGRRLQELLDESYAQVRDNEERLQAEQENARERERQRAEDEAAERLKIEQDLIARMEEARREYENNQARAMRERLDKIKSEASGAADAISGLLGAGLDAGFEKRKDFGKVALKMIGDYMVKRGGAMLTEGAVDLAVGAVSLNPQQVAVGAAKTAGGAALITGGKALGAAGGGGGGKKAAPTATATPAIAPTTQSTTINNQISFGFVGDRRAAARDVAQVSEQSARLGY